MDYLTLVSDTLADAGEEDEGRQLTTLAPGADEAPLTAHQRKAARYVAEAWRLLQTEHRAWPFMREEFTARLEAGPEPKTDYTPAELVPVPPNPAKVWQWWTAGGWYLRETGTPAGQPLAGGAIAQMAWEDFRAAYRVRAPLARSRPVAFAVRPDRTVAVAPAPGVGRAIDLIGEYVRAPQALAGDADEPHGLDPAFHEVIKWRAVMLMLAGSEAGAAYRLAQAAYTDLFTNMMVSEGAGDFGPTRTLA